MVLRHPKQASSPATRAAPALHHSPLRGPARQPGLLAASQESRAETSPQRCAGRGLQLFLQTKTKAATGLEAFGDENMSSPLLFCFCPISGLFKQVHSS